MAINTESIINNENSNIVRYVFASFVLAFTASSLIVLMNKYRELNLVQKISKGLTWMNYTKIQNPINEHQDIVQEHQDISVWKFTHLSLNG